MIHFEILLWAVIAIAAGVVVSVIVFMIKEGVTKNLKASVQLQLEKNTSELIELSSLAEFEKELPADSTVIVLANTIEEPQDALRAAVQDNFQQGVRYIFLVSRSQLSRNIAEYRAFFNAIYIIAKQISPNRGSNALIRGIEFDDIFTVLPLNGEWSSWPYVLYRIPSNGGYQIVVFRGNERREGIAEKYIQLQSVEAEAFFNAVKLSVQDRQNKIFADIDGEFIEDNVININEYSQTSQVG